MKLLYIDPGTGSMLFTILIGVLGAAFYSVRMLFIKLRFKLSGGKVKESDGKAPFVFFADDKRYFTVFEPVIKSMTNRGADVVYMTASEDDPALEYDCAHFKAEFIGSGNKAFARLNFMQASVLVSTTPGLDVYQWKRSKRVDCYVHIPHAASEISLYRMFGIDYYDALLLSGSYQENDVRALEALRGLPPKQIELVGIPYMDKMAERYALSGPAPEHERTVLLAPSWGKSAILSVYGSRILDVLLATGYKIIVRPHPQSFKSEAEMIEGLMKAYPDSDRLSWNRDTDNFEVLRRPDILISDFSGVIFDFTLIYDKPVIYTDPKFDLSPYDAWWLKSPLWTESALPRLGEKLDEGSMADLKGLIDRCIDDPKYAKGRAEVKSETWVHPGEGAERAADFLIAKYKELTEKAPSAEAEALKGGAAV